MNRRTVAYTVLGLFVLTLAFVGLAAADDPILDPNEPPVRLKKKNKRDADKSADKKSEPRKDGEDTEDLDKKEADKGGKDKPPLPEDEADPKEKREQLINRMLKKMETVEERLAKNDPGLSTREMQRDILKDLDALIEQTKQQPPPQGSRSSQSSRSSKNSKSPKNSKNSKNSKNPANRKNSKNSRDKSGSTKDKTSAKSKKGREGKKDGNGQGGGDKNAKNKKNKLADQYKDIWGEMPKTLRLEMDAYSRAKYIREYEALLKQYYRTISEEDRSKKGE